MKVLRLESLKDLLKILLSCAKEKSLNFKENFNLSKYFNSIPNPLNPFKSWFFFSLRSASFKTLPRKIILAFISGCLMLAPWFRKKLPYFEFITYGGLLFFFFS